MNLRCQDGTRQLNVLLGVVVNGVNLCDEAIFFYGPMLAVEGGVGPRVSFATF